MTNLPHTLPDILRDSFRIRTTMTRRRSGGERTVETTYYWNGADQVVLSGYPGRRDWVANIAANPVVTLHTVEFEPWFEIPGRARVIWKTNDRLPHIFNFIGRWAERPGLSPPPLCTCPGGNPVESKAAIARGGARSGSLARSSITCPVW